MVGRGGLAEGGRVLFHCLENPTCQPIVALPPLGSCGQPNPAHLAVSAHTRRLADRWPWPNLDVFVLGSHRPRGTPEQVIVDGTPARLRAKARDRGWSRHPTALARRTPVSPVRYSENVSTGGFSTDTTPPADATPPA